MTGGGTSGHFCEKARECVNWKEDENDPDDQESESVCVCVEEAGRNKTDKESDDQPERGHKERPKRMSVQGQRSR